MVKKILRQLKQNIYHGLKLYPVYDVIAAINKRHPLKGCSALEAFAFTGAWQARAYKQYPAYLEAWEIDPSCEAPLHKNLPGARVKITNTFEEIKRCDRKFDFINADTHQGIFGPYCENFEFFPLIFHVTDNECIVNMNVIPTASPYWRKKYPDLFSAEHLRRRAEFYKTDNPENVSLDTMLRVYGDIASLNNYRITWHYYRQRTLTWYLALHLQKVL
jgi:hypothetical protein